jgi:hypothetical protein
MEQELDRQRTPLIGMRASLENLTEQLACGPA